MKSQLCSLILRWILCLGILTLVGLAAPEPLKTESIYHLSGVWHDQQGKPFELRQLRGQIRVIAMIYTSCRGACPTLVHDMQVLEGRLSPRARPRVSFVLVSIDPAVDTPARLREFAAQKKLTEGRWRLLNGNATMVEDLAAVLGFKYRKTTSTDYVHSNMITVLDSEGLIVHQQMGLQVDPAETLEVIDKLVDNQALPPCCR